MTDPKKKKAKPKAGVKGKVVKSTTKKKFSSKTQNTSNKSSKAKSAKKRHDILMRASGQKTLATNYGKFAGEKRKKNK